MCSERLLYQFPPLSWLYYNYLTVIFISSRPYFTVLLEKSFVFKKIMWNLLLNLENLLLKFIIFFRDVCSNECISHVYVFEQFKHLKKTKKGIEDYVHPSHPFMSTTEKIFDIHRIVYLHWVLYWIPRKNAKKYDLNCERIMNSERIMGEGSDNIVNLIYNRFTTI